MTTATYEYNRYMRNGQTKKMTGFVRSKSKKVQKINELRAAKAAVSKYREKFPEIAAIAAKEFEEA